MATTTSQRPAASTQKRQQPTEHERQVVQEVTQYLRDFARQNPEAAALWCFGIGFVLGWKLKPW
jgi:hypothetical protein